VKSFFCPTKTPVFSALGILKKSRYGKYVYDDNIIIEMKAFFMEEIARLFPQATIDYFI